MATRKKDEDVHQKNSVKKLAEREIPPGSTLPIKALETQQKDEYLLTTLETQVQGALGELQYIAEILATHKKVAPVEDIRRKIQAAYKKMKAYLNPENDMQQPGLEANANRRTSGGIQVEQNPLIKDMGGMPLEVVSPEWQEMIEGQILDKAELENLVNNKLKNKAELANKLANKLKAQNKLTNKAQLKQKIATPKFNQHKIQETLKYILKNTPPPPTPTRTIEPPRPAGM